jgi:predicted amidohydrolase YtcJ
VPPAAQEGGSARREATECRTLHRVLRKAAQDKPAGEWIVARGFQEFKEGRWPHREGRDGILPKHPARLIHWRGQSGIANTMNLAGRCGLRIPRRLKAPGGRSARSRRPPGPAQSRATAHGPPKDA